MKEMKSSIKMGPGKVGCEDCRWFILAHNRVQRRFWY